MRTSTSRQQGLAICAVGVALALTGCGSSSGTSSASPKGGSTPAGTAAAAPTTSAASTTAAAPKPVVVTGQAHGGGDFCKLIAATTNYQAIGGTSAAAIQNEIAHVRAQEQQALDLAPSSLKSDVTLLFTASNTVYDNLAKVNFDYSKLTVSDMSAMSTPAALVAEKHLTTYVTDVCKIS